MKEKDPDVDIAEEPSNSDDKTDDNSPEEGNAEDEKEEIPNGIEKEDEVEEPEFEHSAEDAPQPENGTEEDPPDSNSCLDDEVDSTLVPELPKLSLHGSLPPIVQPKSVAKTSPIFMTSEEKPWSEGESTPYEEQEHVSGAFKLKTGSFHYYYYYYLFCNLQEVTGDFSGDSHTMMVWILMSLYAFLNLD